MVLMAAAAASTTEVAARVRPRVTVAVDVLLPATAEVEVIRAVVELRTVAADHRTAVVDPPTVAEVAADMGGNFALGSFPA